MIAICSKVNCFGGFLSAQQVLPAMLKNGRGTILFSGATASLRGSSKFAAFVCLPLFLSSQWNLNSLYLSIYLSISQINFLLAKPFSRFQASGKFGLRAVAQSLAREFGPSGIHVAHIIIDGPVDNERQVKVM